MKQSPIFINNLNTLKTRTAWHLPVKQEKAGPAQTRASGGKGKLPQNVLQWVAEARLTLATIEGLEGARDTTRRVNGTLRRPRMAVLPAA